MRASVARNRKFVSSLAGSLVTPLASAITGIGAGGYTTTASDYDGANDYASRGADLTGATDADKGIVAMWFRLDGGDGTKRTFYLNGNSRVRLALLPDNTIRVVLTDTGGVDLAVIVSSSTFTASATWRWVALSWDTSSATTTENFVQLYVNDTQEAVDSDVANNPAASSSTDHAVGAVPGGSNKYNGCLSEVFLHFGGSLDLSVEANRRKFIDSNGKPVDLGSDGSTPLGVTPLVYAPDGDPSDNKGSGGNFTITGALTACSSSPSD